MILKIVFSPYISIGRRCCKCRITLKWIFKEQDGMLCTGLTWVATGGGFLSARYWTQFNRSIIVQNLSKEQNLPSEANSFSDSPEIIQILWNPKFIAVSTTALHFPLSKVCSSEPKSPGPRHSHYTDWAAFPFISIHVSTTYPWDLIRPLSNSQNIQGSTQTSDDV